MPARVIWYEPGHILLYSLSDPLTLDDVEESNEQVWALGIGAPGPIDMIFDYRKVTEFPRGLLPIVREGSFRLPTLDRVALVGSDPIVEMMMSTLTRATFRPDPTIHSDVADAGMFLRKMAREDGNR